MTPTIPPMNTPAKDFARPPYPHTLHNPANLTPEQVGEEYRLCILSELDGRHAGIAELYMSWRNPPWWKTTNGDRLSAFVLGTTNSAITYRVPLSVPWPDAPAPPDNGPKTAGEAFEAWYASPRKPSGHLYIEVARHAWTAAISWHTAQTPVAGETAKEVAIDLGMECWKAIVDAASQSVWIPKEHVMNDWVSDVCKFLRDGYGQVEQPIEPNPPIETPSVPVRLIARKVFKEWWSGYNTDLNEGYPADEKKDHMAEAFVGGAEWQAERKLNAANKRADEAEARVKELEAGMLKNEQALDAIFDKANVPRDLAGGHLLNPAQRLESLVQTRDGAEEKAEAAVRERDACHAIFDGLLKFLGYDPYGPYPGLVGAVEKVKAERDTALSHVETLREALELVERIDSNTDKENIEDGLPSIGEVCDKAFAATEKGK